MFNSPECPTVKLAVGLGVLEPLEINIMVNKLAQIVEGMKVFHNLGSLYTYVTRAHIHCIHT